MQKYEDLRIHRFVYKDLRIHRYADTTIQRSVTTNITDKYVSTKCNTFSFQGHSYYI